MDVKNKKRTLVSYKDVQLSYLLDGVPAIQKIWNTGNVSKGTIRRAITKLKETGEDITALEAWIDERWGPVGRGRAAPKVGEIRQYKAQKLKDGGIFLRLPLDSLGVSKGKIIRVEFNKTEIIVSC